MIIEVNGVEFRPYKWEFCIDGKWGHIYFTVPIGTFAPAANNGAYAWDKEKVENEAAKTGEYDMQTLHPEQDQVVHMATPCMGHYEIEGYHCGQHQLSDILEAAAKEIMLNLQRAK